MDVTFLTSHYLLHCHDCLLNQAIEAAQLKVQVPFDQARLLRAEVYLCPAGLNSHSSFLLQS